MLHHSLINDNNSLISRTTNRKMDYVEDFEEVRMEDFVQDEVWDNIKEL